MTEIVRKRTPKRMSLRVVISIIVSVILLFTFLVYKLVAYDTEFSTLSPQTIIKIDVFLHSHPDYMGIQVMSMDLSKNSRHVVYSHLESNEFQKIYMNYISNRISQISPIFTNNNEANNARMIRIINHEFVCSPFSESMLFKNLPASASFIKTICSTSIPPSYGNFVGSVNLFLTNEPTELEIRVIQMYLKEISADIFLEMRH